MIRKSNPTLKFNIIETESAIASGRGKDQFKIIRNRIKEDLNITEGSGEAIFSQLSIAFEINEPVASYLMGQFRKDKSCSSDLQYSITLFVRSSTNPKTIQYLRILSSELGPEGQKWCADCIASINAKITPQNDDSTRE